MAGRPRWWAAGLSLFLAAAVGLAVWVGVGLTQQQATHPGTTHPQPAHGSPAEVTGLLRSLQTAVRSGNATSAAELGATEPAGRSLAAVVRNGRALHVTGFSLRYVDAVGRASPGGALAAHVRASWRFSGFDRRPESMEVTVRFADRDGRLAIAGVGGADRRSPLWLSGPLQVRRSPRALVLVQGEPAEGDRVARLARRAVPQVRRVMPGWPGHLVVEVPASERRLASVLPADPRQYAGIAALTTTVDGSRSKGTPVHVFLNPRAFLPLGQRSAQVVLTHEATHVATEAATSTAPIWLVEGFADYVALRPQRLPLRTTASRIIARVRRDGVPAHLPGRRAFATGAPHLEASYESAWLACRLLATSAGSDALVAFYRAVDAGEPVGPALRSHVGFGLRDLTERWRTVLAHWPA